MIRSRIQEISKFNNFIVRLYEKQLLDCSNYSMNEHIYIYSSRIDLEDNMHF